MKHLIFSTIIAVSILIIPFSPADSFGEMDLSTHGLLLECDDQTRENHLYLMNAEKLGLTDDQIKELQKVKGDCDKYCVLDKAKLRAAKADLNELLKSEEIDMKKAEAKIRAISKLQDRLNIRHLKTKVQSMMLLTDEQKEIAKRIKKKFLANYSKSA